MLIQGSSLSNRTNMLVEHYVKLLNSGVSASRILVLTLNSFKKSLFINQVKEKLSGSLKTIYIENPRIHTFSGLAYNTLSDFWPCVQNSIQTGEPCLIPNLTGLEVSQFFFKQAVKEVGFKDYNSKVNLIHQLFRRYSLIVNNNLSEEDIKSRSAMLGESFAGDAKKAIDIYKKNTAQYRAFDYIRQVAVFSYLYQNTDCFKDVDYLIVDDADEITTAELDFLLYLKPSLKEIFIGYDRHGTSRMGFLNADENTVPRIEKFFSEEKIIDVDEKFSTAASIESLSFSRRLEMVEKALEKIIELINSGVSPSDICVITPVIDNSLKFSVAEKLNSKNINTQYFSGSEKLCSTPLVKMTLTLLNLSLGEMQDIYKIRSLISDMLKIPVKYCMNIVSMYKQSGELRAFDFGIDEYTKRYKTFLNVLQKIKAENLTLSDKVYIIYKEVLDISVNEAEQLKSFNFFMKQIADFESVFALSKYNLSFQKSVLVQLENSIIAENPSSAPELKEDSVTFATAQKIVDYSIKSKYQFWLDISGDLWVKDDFGMLYNAWVFQSSWNKDSFTYEDNIALTREKIKRQLRKLSLLCTQKIFLYSSLFDIEGNENFGGIQDFVEQKTNKENKNIVFNFVPREDQKPVLDYKNGRLAISAVPGAGKTTILLALIIKLIQSGIKSENIFVLTYMDSAARNFKERIKSACPSLEKMPNISTIHGLALRILKENSNYVKAGLDSDFEVCDDNTRQKIIRELIVRCGLEQDDFDKYEKAISALKLSDINSINYVKDVELNKFIKFFVVYNSYLKKRNIIDYDDMLSYCVKILEENHDIADYYQSLCMFVIEDEAQDSSVIQQKLLNILSQKYKNLIRCGDINQAITATFTNADIQGFKDFVTGENNVSMNCSQRCAKDIYNLANKLVETTKHDKNLGNAFYDIKMQGVAGRNPVVEQALRVSVFDDYNAERSFILEKIRKIFAVEPDASIAILVRNNYHIDEYSEFLSCFGYNVITKNDCLDSQPVFALIFAIIKFCAFPWQNERIIHIINVLNNQKLFIFSSADIEFVKTLKSPFILCMEDEMPSPALAKLLWDLNYWLQNSGLDTDELAHKCGCYYYSGEIEKSNIYMISLILKKLSVQYPDTIQLIERLEDLSKRPILNKFKFFTDDNVENKANRGIIQIMTYHKSKGDEFDYVFIPQLSEELLPTDVEKIKINPKERFLESVKAINLKYNKKDEKELKLFKAEENLRLFYVAVTRAKKKLYISCARKYKKYSRIKDTMPSILFERVLTNADK